MRKLISIFSFVLLYVTIAFGQAVNLSVTLTDNAGLTSDIYFGLDLTATDGIDPALLEAGLPGPPPGGGYYGAWILPPFDLAAEQSYYDYRYPTETAGFPYTGTKNFAIKIQSTDYPYTISWNLPPEIASTSTIQDAFGGIFVDEIFAGTSSAVVTNTLITQLNLVVNFENIGGVILPEPIFAIDPLSFGFGSVFVLSTSNTTATISNLGDADLVVQQPVAVGDFSVTGPFPITIPQGGADVDVTITFAPLTEGAQSADLAFVHNAAGTPFLFAVTGTGAGTDPIFRVVPTSLNFGNVTPLTSVDLTVTVFNDGLVDPLIISNATIAASEFSVDLSNASIPAGGNQPFTVTFTPPAVGSYTGTLVFEHNGPGPTSSVSLTGNGYIPPAVFGLVFEEIEVDQFENSSVFNYMHLLATDGPLHAIQFNLATNQETGDNIILTYQSIEKNHPAIAGDNWILETNVVRGTITANGASQDIIYVLLYNIDATGDLPAGDYLDFFKVNYKTAKLPPTIPVQTSTFKINGVEGSTYEGFPVAVTPSRDIFTVNVLAAGGGFGDVNGDGCVDILDLMLVVDHILEIALLTGDEFARADIAPWTFAPGSVPAPDGVVNVQDLSLIQNIILTGFYPNGQPVAPCGYFAKTEGGVDATVTLYINSEGITAYVDAEIGIRGAQIEFGGVTNNPENMVISTPLGQGYYLLAQELLRTLMYDRAAQQYIDAGVNNFMADMPFILANPNDVSVAKIVLVDINTKKLQNIVIQTVYGTPTLPLDYILFQNYPNPFNPTTAIQFQVPKTSDVKIAVYDMLGQEVRTLVAGEVMRGTYTVDWDGMNNAGVKMSSGSYIYRMTAGEFVQSKKMILLK